MGQMPWAAVADGSFRRQCAADTQLKQHCPAAALGFPLPPQRRPKSQSNPASQLDQQVRRFAEPEVAPPAPHVGSENLHRLGQAPALGLPRDFSNPILKALDSLRCDRPPNHRTVGDTEPEKLPLLRPRYRALLLVHLELELLHDESRDAFHHPLTRLFAANINVAIVRISHKAMSPALQFPVELVEHEVAEQWRTWTSWRSSLYAWADQPALHHPGVQKRPDEFQ